MVSKYLSNSVTWLVAAAESFASRKHWRAELVIASFCLSMVTAFPSYELVFGGEFDRFWDPILLQIREPFVHHNDDPLSHASKLDFRLTFPLIAGLLQVGTVERQAALGVSLLIQAIALLGLLYAVSIVANQASGDRVAAIFLTLGFALTFPGNVLASDYRGFFDVVSYAFLAAAMAARHPMLALAFAFLAFYNDERAVIASTLVFLWHLQVEQATFVRTRTIPRLETRATAVAIAVLAYFVTRLALGAAFGLETRTPGVTYYLSLFVEQLNNFALGAWTVLEGFWILVGLALVAAIMRRAWWWIALQLAGILGVAIFAVSVQDITRSMGYMFPALFTAVRMLRVSDQLNFLRAVTLLSALLCLFPTYYASEKYGATMFWPLPLQLIRVLFRLAGS